MAYSRVPFPCRSMRWFTLALALVCSPDAFSQTLAPFLLAEEAVTDAAAAETVDRAEEIRSSPYVSVFADGGVRSGVDGTAESSSATGSLGVTIAREVSREPGYKSVDTGLFQVSVIGTSEGVRERFGNSLLAPASGSTLSAGLIEGRFGDVMRWGQVGIDVRAYGSVATTEWIVPTGEEGTFEPGGEEQTLSVGVLGAGVLFGTTLLEGQIAGNTNVGVVLDVGLSLRSLLGELTTSANGPLRASLFNESEARVFGGLELGFGVQVNGVTAGLNLYQYLGGEIPGVNDGQVVAGIAVKAPISSGRLVSRPAVPVEEE